MNLTLGELIKKLEICSPEAQVVFDFCNFSPTNLASYRGYYEQLAVGYSHSQNITVLDLLKECLTVWGATLYGYKGGNYMMHSETPLWVANWGESHGTAITGVDDLDWKVVIQTQHEEAI